MAWISTTVLPLPGLHAPAAACVDVAADQSRTPMQDESDAEVVKGLSGDDVDKSNIIQGGRRSRKGRGGGGTAPRYQHKVVVDSDEDEW